VADPNLIRFRHLVAGATAHLESRRQEVNDLNVFPVADGDTGDNMVLTMRAVLDELDRLTGTARSTRSGATRSSSPWRARRCSARAATAA
jgi:dihydroxyacetone kinase-like predicted kinase